MTDNLLWYTRGATIHAATHSDAAGTRIIVASVSETPAAETLVALAQRIADKLNHGDAPEAAERRRTLLALSELTPATADALREAADRVDCDNCDQGHTEHDTNAFVCSRDDRDGCASTLANTLRDAAKAIEIRAETHEPVAPGTLLSLEEQTALLEYARNVTAALTSFTTGGSEFFGRQIGGMYTADLPACTRNIRWRFDQANRRAERILDNARDESRRS